MLDLAAVVSDVRQGMIPAHIYGDFAFYLDFYTRQSAAGMELRGPQRWRIKANWKIGAENFAGDSYHTPHTHASVVDIGLFREPRASKRKEGALYTAGPGAGTTYKLPPGGDFADQLRYVSYPDAMIPAMAASWSDRQRALVADSGFMVSAATLFLNLSLVHNWPQIDASGTVALAGPGLAYQGFGEFNQRHWLSLWSDHLKREPAAFDMGGTR